MTAADLLTVQQIAARAALDVPGVAELQPGLVQRLAGAAAGLVRQPTDSRSSSSEGGIRANRDAGSSGWNIEVRCVLHADHRALDIARDVHDRVQAAITSHIDPNASPGAVHVVVTVTRVDGSRAAQLPVLGGD